MYLREYTLQSDHYKILKASFTVFSSLHILEIYSTDNRLFTEILRPFIE